MKLARDKEKTLHIKMLNNGMKQDSFATKRIELLLIQACQKIWYFIYKNPDKPIHKK